MDQALHPETAFRNRERSEADTLGRHTADAVKVELLSEADAYEWRADEPPPFTWVWREGEDAPTYTFLGGWSGVVLCFNVGGPCQDSTIHAPSWGARRWAPLRGRPHSG